MTKRPTVLDNWDETQHDPLSIPPNDFVGRSIEESVELIKDWFFENFEDPVVMTPYESREGGYQYIWGGPYNTRDIIENVFADVASDELLKAAIDELENDGVEWVPNSNRRQPPDEHYDAEPPKPSELHAELLRGIEQLEELVTQLPFSSAGIGHNHPPEAIDAAPFTQEDQIEVRSALKILKEQPIKPLDDGKAAIEAAGVLEKTGNKIRGWLARQGDAFVSEAVKEAGKEFGKWAPRALLAFVVERLFSVSSMVTQWLEAYGIGLPF